MGASVIFFATFEQPFGLPLSGVFLSFLEA
jgi:hypothetical protein